MTVALLHHLLDRQAADTPDASAVRTKGRGWSYRDLRIRSMAYANWLRGHGVLPGDRVLILAPHEPETLALIYAASRLGAIHVVLSDRTRPYHLEHILGDCEPRLVVASARAVDVVAALAPPSVNVYGLDELPADAPGEPNEPARLSIDPLALIYTSGSTAMPKAVVSTHRQVLFTADAIQQRLRYRPDDNVFCCLPLSFDYGLYQVFLCCVSGACLVLGDDEDAGPLLLSRLVDHDISVFPLVPSLAVTLARLIARSHQFPPRLRMVTNTGAALPVTSSTRLREMIPNLDVVSMFGLTECKRVSIAEPNSDLSRPGSTGQPLPDTEAYIIDDNGARLPAGQVGELVVRGPNVMGGYWRAPEMTANRYRHDEFGQPVLHTGDRCRLDEDGNVYFVGRTDDIYKQSGFRVSSIEVEAAAMDVPGVELAAVLPPDNGNGARLVATGTISAGSLATELAVRLEEHKIPDDCRVLPELPLSVNGKIDKRALTDLLDARLQTEGIR
ncbi:acyl--CoA ligase [Amycolatopsis sp. NBC_00345]|uniref:class I adenylate-forming enzyme family protein n=1 Tax=Amycolatopsis sp. NBC_00345 TaxID=2975955 RepID=UPI002E25780C